MPSHLSKHLQSHLRGGEFEMKNPTTVYIRLKTAEGKEVERAIDITNLLLHVGDQSRIAQNEETQRELLNDWIKYRGNEQHNTTLTLLGWTVA